MFNFLKKNCKIIIVFKLMFFFGTKLNFNRNKIVPECVLFIYFSFAELGPLNFGKN